MYSETLDQVSISRELLAEITSNFPTTKQAYDWTFEG